MGLSSYSRFWLTFQPESCIHISTRKPGHIFHNHIFPKQSTVSLGWTRMTFGPQKHSNTLCTINFAESWHGCSNSCQSRQPVQLSLHVTVGALLGQEKARDDLCTWCVWVHVYVYMMYVCGCACVFVYVCGCACVFVCVCVCVCVFVCCVCMTVCCVYMCVCVYVCACECV